MGVKHLPVQSELNEVTVCCWFGCFSVRKKTCIDVGFGTFRFNNLVTWPQVLYLIHPVDSQVWEIYKADALSMQFA